jgi:hypothetical protein
MASNIRYLLIFSFLNCFRPHWPIAIIYFHAVTGSFTAAMAVYSVVFLRRLPVKCQLEVTQIEQVEGVL